MGDSQHSSAYGRCGAMPSSVDAGSMMTVNSAGLRYSGVLSPLAWQAPRPNSPVSLTMLGLSRRDTLSTSSIAPSNVSLSTGHRRQVPRGLEHRGVPAPTPSSSTSSRVMDTVATAGSPLSVDAASMLTVTERTVLLARLKGFHDFAERLPGYYTGDCTASATVVTKRIEGDAALQRFQFPEQPRLLERPLALPSTQQQSGGVQKLVAPSSAMVAASQQGKAVVSFPKSCDASITCEVANVSVMSVLSEMSHKRADDVGRLERSICKEGEEDRPATAPAAGPPRFNGTSHALNEVPDLEAPPGVTDAFHRYLEQARERILCTDSSDVDRSSALDGLLTRCRELFDLLRDMYAVMNAQSSVVDRKNLSMVKVLPYDEVSSSSSSSSSSVPSTSSFEPSAAMKTHEGHSGVKGSLLRATTRPSNAQLPPLSKGPLANTAVLRSQDAFERGRRTSASSCSSGVGCIDVLNNYYVMRLIGVGATGRVYLSIERKTCKTYAIKTVTRQARKIIGRRFPVASLSASESEAMRSDGSPLGSIASGGEVAPLDGSPLEGSSAEGGVTRGDGNPISNTSPPLVRPPATVADSSYRTVLQEDTQDSMFMSPRESAVESLVKLATISHPSDSIIPFVDSVTVSAQAMPSGNIDGEFFHGTNRIPPRTSTGKYSKAPSTTSHEGVTLTHASVNRLTNGAEVVGSDGVSKSLNSTPTSELSPVEREIRIMRRVRNHPNVVRLKEVIDDEEEGAVHLVMTYAENGPLTVMHGFDTSLGCAPCDVVRPFSRCIRLLHQLAEALIYVHRQRIVHNDVKPDNILLTEADNILLTDFGESVLISKKPVHLSTSHMSVGASTGEALNTSVLVPHNRWKSPRGDGDSWAALSTLDRSPWCPNTIGHTANLSQMVTEVSFLPDSSMFLTAGVDVEGRLKENRSAIGTPAFAAPELIMSSTCSYDSDAWSFGVVLYSVIFGRLPFAAATISDTFDEILHSSLSFPAMEEVPQRVGMTEAAYDQWVELCTKLLVREPQQRLPLPAVLRHPLFRRQSILGSRSSISISGGMEASRGRHPSSGLHCDLSSGSNRRRSFRSHQVSLLSTGTEAPHATSRSARATLLPTMTQDAAAAAAAAVEDKLSSRRCSVDDSTSPMRTDGAGRGKTPEGHPMQTTPNKSQNSSRSASFGASNVSLSPPLSSPTAGSVLRTNPADGGVMQSPLDDQSGSVADLHRKSGTQHSMLTGRYSLLGASSVSTASFTTSEQFGRLRENTLVYNQGSARHSSSASESLINPSFFSTSMPFGESPPDPIATPVMLLKSSAEFFFPSPQPITRPGSNTPEVGSRAGGEGQRGERDLKGSNVPFALGTPTIAEAASARATPTWLPSAPSGERTRLSAGARETHEGTRMLTQYVGEVTHKEELPENERGGATDFNCFSYWDSSMSDLADSCGSDVEGVQGRETVGKLSQRSSPQLRRSCRPSLNSPGCARPLVSVQEMSSRPDGQRGRCKRVQFMPGLSPGDAAIALGGCRNSGTSLSSSPRVHGVKAPVQQRVSNPSPPSVELKADGAGCVRLSSRESSHKSTSELPPAKTTKSWLWRHR